MVCSYDCAIKHANKKAEKEERQHMKLRKEGLLTHSDWTQRLQKVFNSYIRKRDEGKPCISCETILSGKFDAGHYFSVGAYPALRFHEDNVHGQCVHCNQHKHGNISEYSLRLPKRIGQREFDELCAMRKEVRKYTIDEIKELIQRYKTQTHNKHERD